MSESKSVVRHAMRVAWETSMDFVAVTLSYILRFGLFLRNHYADSDRLCAQLEKTRLRRTWAEREDCAGRSCAATLLEDDCFVVDARREDEFSHSHVYSAVNCHYSRVEDIEEIFAKHGVRMEQFIVVYCAVGLRSGWVAKKLRKRGYRNASVLFGGYYHWVNSGHPIYNGNERAFVVLPQHLPASMLLPSHIKISAKQAEAIAKKKALSCP